jgi:hypothetical protein
MVKLSQTAATLSLRLALAIARWETPIFPNPTTAMLTWLMKAPSGSAETPGGAGDKAAPHGQACRKRACARAHAQDH